MSIRRQNHRGLLESSAFLVYYAHSIEKTADFWQKLGANIKESAKDKVVVSLCGYEIHYIQEGAEPFAEYQFATKKDSRGQGVLLYIGVSDVEAFMLAAKSAQTKLHSGILNNNWDGKEFLFSDPDGYLFAAYCMNL